MSENIKNLTLKGLFWNALDRVGFQLVTTLVGIITARVLSVSDFAVIGVLSIFSVIATSIVDSGLATSLVRSKVVEDKDYSSMFVFNLAVSTIIYLALFIAAPYIEEFYGIDNLALYARVLFLQLLLNAFGIVQYVKILKRSKFNITARVNVLSVVLSGVIAVTLALTGFGTWALILQPVLYITFRTTMFWIWGDWKMDFFYSGASIKKHMEFSLSFMGANLLGKILSPLYVSVVGKYYDTDETGHYFQANRWGETPNLLISSIVQGTTLSTLTPIQDDYERFLNACRKAFSTLAFVLFPVSMLAITVAYPGFMLVLTEKYESAVVYFQLLCATGIFISFTDMNVNFINIKGRSKYALVLEVIKLTSAAVVLFLTVNHGLLSIIYGQLSVRLLCYVLSARWSSKIYGYNLILQLKDLAPYFLNSLIAACLSYIPLYFSVVNSYLVMLIIQSVLFLCVYVGLNHIFKNPIWVEGIQLIKVKFKKA
ncbi:MAG: lipopolysaccharide biosynthesis protein [Sphingobacterium sp.]|jgi:O-antigen/teichoic acid export membrane protein|nr:lipopolysaccharide biosynthesis protein [Sphingobacterium sp.]